MKAAFRGYDKNGDGRVSKAEFKRVMLRTRSRCWLMGNLKGRVSQKNILDYDPWGVKKCANSKETGRADLKTTLKCKFVPIRPSIKNCNTLLKEILLLSQLHSFASHQCSPALPISHLFSPNSIISCKKSFKKLHPNIILRGLANFSALACQTRSWMRW